MPLLGGEVILQNTTLDVLLLPKNSRVPTKKVLTLATAALEGATTLSLQVDATTVDLKAGTSLSFAVTGGRRHAVIVDDVTVATTATDVNVLALNQAIAINATADYYVGLQPVYGLQDFSLQSQDQSVDTTNSLSGNGTEMALVRSGKTFNCSVIAVPNDRGFNDIIKKVALSQGFFGREIWACLNMPDGELYRGAAKVQNFNAPGNQNEVKRGSFDLTYMGSSFEYLPAYVFA